MSSVRIANNHIGGVLEVAAEYVENGVRRATNDCVQKTPNESVVAHPDAGRSRQGLVAENVAVAADGIGRDRPCQDPPPMDVGMVPRMGGTPLSKMAHSGPFCQQRDSSSSPKS